MVSFALIAVISVGTYKLTNSLHKGQRITQDKQSSSMASRSTFRDIEKFLNNAILIRPSEWLASTGGERYRGLAGVDPSQVTPASAHLSDCRYVQSNSGESFSVFRFTRLLDKLTPNRVLRRFDESDVGSNAPSKRLIVRHVPESATDRYVAMGSEAFAPEIVIIDADTTDRRRYRVQSVVEDKPAANFSEDNIAFRLRMPKRLNGQNHPKTASINFVSDSLVYGVTTQVVCVNQEGLLQLVDENSGVKRILLNPKPENQTITSFTVRYVSSQESTSLIQSTFQFYPFGDPTVQRCLNLVELKVFLQSTEHSESPPQVMRRLILLTNINSNRPASCDS